MNLNSFAGWKGLAEVWNSKEIEGRDGFESVHVVTCTVLPSSAYKNWMTSEGSPQIKIWEFTCNILKDMSTKFSANFRIPGVKITVYDFHFAFSTMCKQDRKSVV